MSTALKIEHLCKTINGKNIIEDINLEIPHGRIVGFIGPNGAGKTTTMKLCCGIAAITSGNIFVNDISIKDSFETYMEQIGVSLCNTNFYGKLTAMENIRIFSSLLPVTDKRIEEVIELVGLDNRKESQVCTFSLGMKQRLSVALAILHKPKVVLLDEPFNGIDPKGVSDLRDIITRTCAECDTSFLISSHNLSEISKIASMNYYINHGRIMKAEEMPANQSFICIRVDKPEVLQEILFKLETSFSREADTFFFRVENEKLTYFFWRIFEQDIQMLEFSTGSYLERQYIEMMGESCIE